MRERRAGHSIRAFVISAAAALVVLQPQPASADLPWSISLEASSMSVRGGASVTLTATANRPVDAPLFLIIFRQDGNINVAECKNGLYVSCKGDWEDSGPATHRFVAYIWEDLGEGRYRTLASSKEVAVVWRPSAPAPSTTTARPKTTAKRPAKTTTKRPAKTTARKPLTTTTRRPLVTTTTPRPRATTTTVRLGVAPGEGSRIVFSGGGPLVTVSSDGTDRRTIVADGRNSFPAWSPNRDRIAFMRAAALDYNLYEIYVIGASGSSLTRLTDNAVYDADPTWSPDGQRIAFVSARDVEAGEQIWTMKADGSSPVTTGVRGGAPAWSPDGKRLAFVTTTGQVALMAPDGSGVARLTGADLTAASPTWSPDGKRIAFVGGPIEGGEMSVFVTDLVGGGPKRLTAPAHFLQTVAWSAGGSKLVYDRATSDTSGMEVVVVDAVTGRAGGVLGAGFGPDW